VKHGAHLRQIVREHPPKWPGVSKHARCSCAGLRHGRKSVPGGAAAKPAGRQPSGEDGNQNARRRG